MHEARNKSPVDAEVIEVLTDLNIPVFFEKESINTMDTKGEVLLTIMASLSQ